jgi:hypothetical protein
MVRCLITHRDKFTFTSYPVNHLFSNNDQEFGTACYYILDCLVTPFGPLLQKGRKTKVGGKTKKFKLTQKDGEGK